MDSIESKKLFEVFFSNLSTFEFSKIKSRGSSSKGYAED